MNRHTIAAGNPARVLREITEADRTGYIEQLRARDAAVKA